MSLQVAVCGPGDASADEEVAAEEVGRRLARAGAVVICGGYGGVMAAVARGATAAGGIAVGILSGEEPGEANRFLTVALPTGLGQARNALVVYAADAVIAIGGEFGTLSEVALALKIGRPLVGLHTWELAKRGEEVVAFERVETPGGAVERALALARGAAVARQQPSSSGRSGRNTSP